jgi:hypothetical protein
VQTPLSDDSAGFSEEEDCTGFSELELDDCATFSEEDSASFSELELSDFTELELAEIFAELLNGFADS